MTENYEVKKTEGLSIEGCSMKLQEAHQKTLERVVDDLYEGHSAKLFHSPLHTLGEPGVDDLTSVRGGVRTLSTVLRESFKDTYAGLSEAGNHAAAATLAGLEAGVVGHDVVIELEGIQTNGMIKRKRGWEEGGNERESFRLVRRAFLQRYAGNETPLSPEEEVLMHDLLTSVRGPDYDPEYTVYMKGVEQAIAGTDPDRMRFGYVLDQEPAFAALPEATKACLRVVDEAGQVNHQCFMIDSAKAEQSLPALLASTADLGGVADPEFFERSGNAEFWELHYGFSDICASFMRGERMPTRAEVATCVRAMADWRKTQVGVAVGQQVRLDRYYEPTRIASLYNETFHAVPTEGEVDVFIEGVRDAFSQLPETIMYATQVYETFLERFAALQTMVDDAGPLTKDEQELFTEAIKFMNGAVDRLTGYVDHVRAVTKEA